ncbi:hypothetical protein FOA52_003121 [Chlamydomonas sp. UWO 241]|nr:hypothetical protein FOA52_003121 [Chlamydomonas sp. UWO 241]
MSRSAMLLAMLVGVLALTVPMASLAEDEDHVVVLTTDNFDGIIVKSKFALVEFYAPWCGHCKKLEVPYKEAALKLKDYALENGIVLAKVDATEQAALGEKFGVKGYPTIKWFIDGEVSADYNGGRDTEGIVSWIKKKTGPFATDLKSAAELTAFEKESSITFVAYFKTLEGAAFEAFKSFASKTEDVAFATTTDAAVAKAAGLTAVDTLAVIKNEEKREVVVMKTKMTADDAVTDFVNAEKMPLTIEFNSGNSNKIFKSGINIQIIFWAKAAEMKDGKAFTVLQEVAKAYKGKIVFVTTTADGPDAEPITKFFGLAGKEGPVAMGFMMEKNTKFFYEGEYTVAALSKFAESLIDGTAEPSFKSADIPAEPLDEGVTVVVGKNFNSVVLAADKDVLLEVYAPWCGHCKTLAPIYIELAKKFAGVSSVVIAKMDGTENEHAAVDAKGYPTLLFYPAGATKAMSFQGDRSLEALAKYIEENAKIPVVYPEGADEGETEATEADDEASKDEL